MTSKLCGAPEAVGKAHGVKQVDPGTFLSCKPENGWCWSLRAAAILDILCGRARITVAPGREPFNSLLSLTADGRDETLPTVRIFFFSFSFAQMPVDGDKMVFSPRLAQNVAASETGPEVCSQEKKKPVPQLDLNGQHLRKKLL